MDLTNTLWNSRTHSRTKGIMLLVCLVLLIPSLVGMFITTTMEDRTMMGIMIIVTAVIILATASLLLAGRFTGLKWCVSNLLFAVAESGFYFTGTVNQDSYFSAQWEEITGYSVKAEKNGLATVTVYFDDFADCGSFGKNKSVKMVKISDVETLKSVFETKNIKSVEA